MVNYRELKDNEITPELFSSFDRYQKGERCWTKENGEWLLKDMPFEENWDSKDIAYLVKCLKSTLATGGTVYGAFKKGVLAGFSSVENEFFGERREYLQLSSIHVSNQHRGKGIGRELFRLSAERAKQRGAKKLYISAHPSEESQAFYKAISCLEANEYNQRLAVRKPFDCQMEYRL